MQWLCAPGWLCSQAMRHALAEKQRVVRNFLICFYLITCWKGDAALLLTPIVIAILLRLNFTPMATLAFIVATGFVADTTSLPLIISNLVNIVTANYFDISFGRYAAVMVPVNLVSLLATLLVVWLMFARDIPRDYALEGLESPQSAVKDPLVFRLTFPLLVVLLLAYFVTAPLGVPVSVVTGAAAVY